MTEILDKCANQAVFDVYLGLTACGYNLGNPLRGETIRPLIETGTWSQPTRRYFHFAHIEDGRINPYWPRASLLTAVSLLLDQRPGTQQIELVRTYFASQDNISPDEKSEAVVRWAADLPQQATRLHTSKIYTEAWKRYKAIIQDEIDNNGAPYNAQINQAQSCLRQLLAIDSIPIPVTTILNPLQADPLTDIVTVHGQTYVITSHLRAEAFIHELLHVSLEPYLPLWQTRISASANLLDPVYPQMAYLSYAWDRSAAAWQNVFTETLVRVLTILVAAVSPDAQRAQIVQLVQQGFIYARPIAESLALPDGKLLSAAWLEHCLQACAAKKEQIT